MALEYSYEMMQADALIDYLKETENKYSGLAIVCPIDDGKRTLTTTVIKNHLMSPLLKAPKNIFSNILINIEESTIPANDILIYVGGTNTGRPDYNLYKDFIKYAYENLIDKNRRKALVTPKYVLVPYGLDYEDFGDFSTYPSYLVYEH